LKFKKTFLALGNDRPQILLQLEDCVLQAIIAIWRGESSEVVIDSLHSQIQPLEKDLCNDDVALKWFDLSGEDLSTPSTTRPSEFPTTPLLGVIKFFSLYYSII
jgi:hypothetical protein